MRSRPEMTFKGTIFAMLASTTCALTWPMTAALARTVEAAPDLDAWIEEVRKSDLPLQSIPQRILLLDSRIDDPSQKNFLAEATIMDKLSPFVFIDGASSALTAKLNRDPSAGAGKGRRVNLAEATSANVVIAEMSGKAPVLYVNNGKTLRKLGNLKPYNGDKSPNLILSWLFQNLGYDGILLARKGSYVLVTGSAQVLGREKIQALAIRGSDSQLALLDKKRSGSSLLEIESSKGPYALFRILALAKDSGELPTGIKLTIQRDPGKKDAE